MCVEDIPFVPEMISVAFLETRLISFIFQMYSSNPYGTDFYHDIVVRLPQRDKCLFDRIMAFGGPHSVAFQELLVESRCGFYKQISDKIDRAIYHFSDGRIKQLTLRQLSTNLKISPYNARCFVIAWLGQVTRIHRDLVLIDRFTIEYMRNKGFHVPARLTIDDYWKYEYIYVHLIEHK